MGQYGLFSGNYTESHSTDTSFLWAQSSFCGVQDLFFQNIHDRYSHATFGYKFTNFQNTSSKCCRYNKTCANTGTTSCQWRTFSFSYYVKDLLKKKPLLLVNNTSPTDNLLSRLNIIEFYVYGRKHTK